MENLNPTDMAEFDIRKAVRDYADHLSSDEILAIVREELTRIGQVVHAVCIPEGVF